MVLPIGLGHAVSYQVGIVVRLAALIPLRAAGKLAAHDAPVDLALIHKLQMDVPGALASIHDEVKGLARQLKAPGGAILGDGIACRDRTVLLNEIH